MESISLEEAEAIMGVHIPVPAYLPSGYQIQYVVAESTRLGLLYSDEPITYPSPGEIIDTWQEEFQRPGGARLLLDIQKRTPMPDPGFWVEVDEGRLDVDGDVVDLGQVSGLLVDPSAIEYPDLGDDAGRWPVPGGLDDVWQLSWWQDGLEYMLKAPKTMSKGEVLRIASSVPKQHQIKEVSLLQAEASLGTKLSDIDLNEGYEVRRIFLWEDRFAYLLISDADIDFLVDSETNVGMMIAKPSQQTGAKIVLTVDTQITQSAYQGYDLFEILLDGGDLVDFNGGKAIYRQMPDYHEIEWFTEDRHFKLKAVEQVPLSDFGTILQSEVGK